jgi:hypothetical protein
MLAHSTCTLVSTFQGIRIANLQSYSSLGYALHTILVNAKVTPTSAPSLSVDQQPQRGEGLRIRAYSCSTS